MPQGSVYSVTLTNPTGVESFSRGFKSLTSARNWAKWLLSGKVPIKEAKIYLGEPGGILIETKTPRTSPTKGLPNDLQTNP